MPAGTPGLCWPSPLGTPLPLGTPRPRDPSVTPGTTRPGGTCGIATRPMATIIILAIQAGTGPGESADADLRAGHRRARGYGRIHGVPTAQGTSPGRRRLRGHGTAVPAVPAGRGGRRGDRGRAG